MSDAPILYVEDEEDYQIVVKRILEKKGLRLQVVSTGVEALRMLECLDPRLLILDVNLPDTDGYTLCAEIRKQPRWQRLPILMLTVRRRPEEWLRGFSAGADDYIPKPINPLELEERVRFCLNLRSNEPHARRSSREGSEFRLIQAVVAGNKTAFEVLVEKYQRRLTHSLRGAGKSAVDSEDAVSTAFAKAYEQLREFRGEASFYTWLYRIAFNEKYIRNRFQKSSVEEMTRWETLTLPTALTIPDRVGDGLSSQAMQLQLQRAVSKVPQPYRRMLKWHFVRGFSYETISRRLCIPRGTVMSRLFRAKQLLRRSWVRSGTRAQK